MLENNKNYLLYGNYQNPAVGTETQTLFYTYILVFIAIGINGIEGILRIMQLHKNAAKKWLSFLTIINY